MTHIAQVSILCRANDACTCLGTHVIFTAPISYGKTKTRSLTGEKGHLSYPANAKVTVYSRVQRGPDGVEFLEAEVCDSQTTKSLLTLLIHAGIREKRLGTQGQRY